MQQLVLLGMEEIAFRALARILQQSSQLSLVRHQFIQ